MSRFPLALALFLGPLLVHSGTAESVQPDPLFSRDLTLLPVDHWERDDDILRIARAGKPTGPLRRPTTYALLAGRWSDVNLSVEARSLEPSDKVGRDIVLIFGYQDARHYYYAHVSNDSDGRTHSVIMRVDDPERTPIQLEADAMPALRDGWQTLSLTHSADGAIAVSVDGQLALTAHDTRYPTGAVGFGSFNDRAEFRAAVIEGEQRDD